MLKTLMRFVPGLGPVMTFGPWVLVALMLSWGLWESRAVATAKLSVATCQTEAATEAEAESAAAAAQVAKAQAAANAATAQLMASRADAAKVQAAAQSALAASLNQIDADAAKPGEDGPIPAVLAGEFQ
jgi:hypothetical protein